MAETTTIAPARSLASAQPIVEPLSVGKTYDTGAVRVEPALRASRIRPAEALRYE